MCFDLLTKNHKQSLVSLAVRLTLVKPIIYILFHFFIMIIFDSVLCIAFHHSECIVFFCGNICPKLIAWLLRCDVLVIALSVFCESSRLTTWHFGANLGPLSVSSSCVIVCIRTILWGLEQEMRLTSATLISWKSTFMKSWTNKLFERQKKLGFIHSDCDVKICKARFLLFDAIDHHLALKSSEGGKKKVNVVFLWKGSHETIHNWWFRWPRLKKRTKIVRIFKTLSSTYETYKG